MLHTKGDTWAGLGEDGETERELAAKGMAQAKSWGRGRLRPQMANKQALPPGAAVGPPSGPGAEHSLHPRDLLCPLGPRWRGSTGEKPLKAWLWGAGYEKWGSKRRAGRLGWLERHLREGDSAGL